MSLNTEQILQELFDSTGSTENLITLINEFKNFKQRNEGSNTEVNNEDVSETVMSSTEPQQVSSQGSLSEASESPSETQQVMFQGIAPVFLPSDDDKHLCSEAAKNSPFEFYFSFKKVLIINGLSCLIDEEEQIKLIKSLNKDGVAELHKTMKEIYKFVNDTAQNIFSKDAKARLYLNNNQLAKFLDHIKDKYLHTRDNFETWITRKLDKVVYDLNNKKSKSSLMKLKEINEDIEIFNINIQSINERIFENSVKYLNLSRKKLTDFSIYKLMGKSNEEIKNMMIDDFKLLDMNQYDSYFNSHEAESVSLVTNANKTSGMKRTHGPCSICNANFGHKSSCEKFDPELARKAAKRYYENRMKYLDDYEKNKKSKSQSNRQVSVNKNN